MTPMTRSAIKPISQQSSQSETITVSTNDRGYARIFGRIALYGLFIVSAYLTLPDIMRYLFSTQENSVPNPTLLSCVACDVSSDLFDDITLEARAAYVYDIGSQKTLFAKNAEVQLPLASLTKGMTALVVRTHLSADATITIFEDDLSEEGDSGLSAHEVFSYDDLSDMMLSVSSNDGARALARSVGMSIKTDDISLKTGRGRFIDAMNTVARELALTQTFFQNETGLDESIYTAGAYGSAHDMALLYAHIVKEFPDMIEATTYSSLIVSSDTRVHTVHNTNMIAGDIPGLSASKTGFTDLAGGNLVIVFEPEPLHPVAIVVLGSSREGRFSDMRALIAATMNTYARDMSSPDDISRTD